MKEDNCNTTKSNKSWSPSSWRNFTISQQPEYSDPQHVDQITDKVYITQTYFLIKISNLPSLVSKEEIDILKDNLSKVK